MVTTKRVKKTTNTTTTTTTIHTHTHKTMTEIMNFIAEPVHAKYSVGDMESFRDLEQIKTKIQKTVKVQTKETSGKPTLKVTKTKPKKTDAATAQAKRDTAKKLRAYRKYLTVTASQENLQRMEKLAIAAEDVEDSILKEQVELNKSFEAREHKLEKQSQTPTILNYADLVANGLDRNRTNPFVSTECLVDTSDCMLWLAESDAKDSFTRKYEVKELIGEGTYGQVYRVTTRSDNKEYVAKVLNKKHMNYLGIREYVEREIAINGRFCATNNASSFVTRFVESMETPFNYYLVFEYIVGKSLMTRMNRPTGSEATVRAYFTQILEALAYIHACGVFHGDLQLSNIMLQTDSNPTNVKLIDFGCSNYVDHNRGYSKFSGNLYFAAPELLSGGNYAGPEIDIWSAGVCLYKMLTGYLPFDRAADAVKLRFAVPLEEDDTLSETARDIFEKIFVVEGKDRPTAQELLKHPWINEQ